MTLSLFFDPSDTFIIRDGRPFNQDDEGRAAAASLFPPPVDTMYGAARVALARALGWSGKGDWSHVPGCGAALGSYEDRPGDLVAAGPYLMRGAEDRVLVPAPAHLRTLQAPAGRGAGRVVALRPADGPVDTDLGPARLLQPPGGAGKETTALDGAWIEVEGLYRLLEDWGRSGAADIVAAEDELVATETRIGLARDNEGGSRLAREGMLYQSARRRPRAGIRFAVECDGVEIDPVRLKRPVPFGSESRFAWVSARKGAMIRQPKVRLSGGRYLVALITPALIDVDLKPGGAVRDLPGRLVSAAVRRIAMRGTFSSRDDGRGARAVGTMVPAGSVLFFEGGEPRTGDRPGRLGDRSHMGFGRYLIGAW